MKVFLILICAIAEPIDKQDHCLSIDVGDCYNNRLVCLSPALNSGCLKPNDCLSFSHECNRLGDWSTNEEICKTVVCDGNNNKERSLLITTDIYSKPRTGSIDMPYAI